jgi:uncharacterized protein YqjF (DUF2071 family)
MAAEQPVAVREAGANAVKRWRWSQSWRNVFFAHWPMQPERLRPLLPRGLEPDTWGERAWVSVVAFHLQVRHRGLPPLGPCFSFLELNLRTYVRRDGEAAIYFLSIHAGSRLAVRLARWLTPLPYALACITYERCRSAWRFDCRLAAVPAGPLFRAEFQHSGYDASALGDPLDEWLLERYCAYMSDRHGRLHRMVVTHPPWQAAVVGAEVTASRLGALRGLDLQRSPERCHFARSVEALLWRTEVV